VFAQPWSNPHPSRNRLMMKLHEMFQGRSTGTFGSGKVGIDEKGNIAGVAMFSSSETVHNNALM